MGHISERALVHCAVHEAARYLSRFFHARGNTDGDVARLHLRADVAVGGESAMKLERTAIATIFPVHRVGDMVPRYAVTWSAERSGPYPRFAGELRIENTDDYDSFDLVLEGDYELPLGAIGAAFDAVAGHRIAASTARNLLATIAGSIESAFDDAEASKAEARKVVLATVVDPQ